MRSHTVILGACATIAAIPDGDKNGKSSSVMNGLLKKLNLEEILAGVELQTKSENLEDIYSELFEREECSEIVRKLEERLYDYFASLELPDEPTIYDFLILSLTNKDCIATFNWDPLLIQAYIRCSKITLNLPKILCLHGNVAVGFCEKHIEFAELALQWNAQALRIDEMELENFLEDTVPLMSESNIRLAIFPIDEKTETIIFDPIEFAKMINDYFYEWYGEEFDLPYLLGG